MDRATRTPVFLRFLEITTVVLFILIGGSVALFSQCPPISSTNRHWARNSTVYYDISSISDPKIASSINEAFKEWNTANQYNGTGVTFVPGGSDITFFFGGSNGKIAAETTRWADDETHLIVCANINYYTQGKISSGLIYDPSKDGYYGLFYLVTLHEIGHMMGLDDVPSCCQTPEQSVMNSAVGPNDMYHNLPMIVTYCDNGKLESPDSPYYISGGGGGDGDGGGSGGDDPGCTPMYIQTVRYINDVPIPIGDPIYWGCY